MSETPPLPAAWLAVDLGDAAANLALDEALLEAAHAGTLREPIVRTWMAVQPTVVLGSSSRIDDEVDRDPTQHAAALIVGNQATGRWGIMPVGLGAERLASKVRTLAGWTSVQRYGVADRPAEPQGDRAGAAAASDSEPPISTAPTGTTPAATAAPTTE